MMLYAIIMRPKAIVLPSKGNILECNNMRHRLIEVRNSIKLNSAILTSGPVPLVLSLAAAAGNMNYQHSPVELHIPISAQNNEPAARLWHRFAAR